jgi:molybdate transport system substrate-binding protein
VRGGAAAERVARGDADIALQQASEIKMVPAVKFAGMLPEQIQNYTIYSGAITADTTALQAATELMSAFSDPSAEPILRRRGLEMP